MFNKINVALYSMQPIKKLFQGKVFDKYEQKKSELDLLHVKLIKSVASEIRPYIKIKDRIEDVLIVEVTKNSVSHKIKMSSASILKKMNADKSLNLKKIKIKIAIYNPVSKKINKTSISSIDPMKKLCNEIADSPLKVYLKQIFKRK